MNVYKKILWYGIYNTVSIATLALIQFTLRKDISETIVLAFIVMNGFYVNWLGDKK